MSNFFFNRQPPSSRSRDNARSGARTHNGVTAEEGLSEALRGVVEAQSITASAIFAMLVSKGVLSADEAADYMREIGAVLRRDVTAPAGPAAGSLLASYGEALIAADR
jgi:hypothetical protein